MVQPKKDSERRSRSESMLPPSKPSIGRSYPRNWRERFQLRLDAAKESRFSGLQRGLRKGVHGLCELGISTLDGHFRFEYPAPQGFFDVLLGSLKHSPRSAESWNRLLGQIHDAGFLVRGQQHPSGGLSGSIGCVLVHAVEFFLDGLILHVVGSGEAGIVILPVAFEAAGREKVCTL
jgi:hypothetical protein